MKQEKIVADNTNGVIDTSLEAGKNTSLFQMVIVSCLRHKQLNRGATPRIVVPSKKTKKTRIAIEEVNQGLIVYNAIP
jgi:DNA-directed RNA polymerase omega subunit